MSNLAGVTEWSEQDIRRIVREELAAMNSKSGAVGNGQSAGYVLHPAAVRALISAAESYGVSMVTIGVMERGTGPLGTDSYVGIVCEDVAVLRASLEAK